MLDETTGGIEPFQVRDSADQGWLDHLSSLYTIEYTLLNVATSLGAVAAAVISAFVIQLPPNCASVDEGDNCLGDWTYVFIPIAPALVVLFFGYLFFSARTVGKYARTIERQLSSPTGEDIGTLLRPPALSRLNGALFGGESPRLFPMRVFYVIFATAVIAVGIFTLVTVITRIDDPTLRGWTFASYAFIAIVLAWIYAYGASHATWDALVVAAISRDSKLTRTRRPTVSWTQYCAFVILPRPLSMLKGIDGLWVLAAVALLLYPAFDAADLGKAVAALVAFEWLLYQTRYLWNGVREDPDAKLGLPADRRNDPAAPYKAAQALLAPLLGLARIAAFYLVVTYFELVPARTAAQVIVLFVAIYYLYEIPREVARRRLRANRATGSVSSRDALSRLLFVTVGLGYALRAYFCICVLSPAYATDPVGAGIWISFWAAGCAGVAAGWVIEFSGAIRRSDRAIHRNALGKPHLLWAARHATGLVPQNPTWAEFDHDQTLEKDQLSLDRYPGAARTPWRLALIVAVAALAPVAWLADPIPPFAALIVLVAVLPFVPRLVPWLRLGHPGVFIGCIVLASALALVAIDGDPGRALAALVILFGAHVARVSAAETGQLFAAIAAAQRFWARLRGFARAVWRTAVSLAELLVGHAVVHAMQHRFAAAPPAAPGDNSVSSLPPSLPPGHSPAP